MKYRKFIFTLLITLSTCTAFAADQAAKEDTTPPAQEGPIPIDQIPPIVSQPEGTPPPSSLNPTNSTNPPL
jgi:hypothetical protein